MAVTISDVAHAAGVSKGAVSYALNGQPGVSQDTRDRILRVANELGWKPNLRAKGLSSAKAYALGLVVARDPSLLGTDPFFPAFIAGIETALAEHDYTLVLSVATAPGAEERCYRKLVDNGRVDGVILTDVRHNDSRIALLLDLKVPGRDPQPARRQLPVSRSLRGRVGRHRGRRRTPGGPRTHPDCPRGRRAGVHPRPEPPQGVGGRHGPGRAAVRPLRRGRFHCRRRGGRHRGTAPAGGPANRHRVRERPDGHRRPVLCPVPWAQRPRRPVHHRLRQRRVHPVPESAPHHPRH